MAKNEGFGLVTDEALVLAAIFFSVFVLLGGLTLAYPGWAEAYWLAWLVVWT
jgi:hypothetical protein